MPIEQVDLMCADCSITVYPKTDRCKGGRGGRREIEFPRMSRSSMETARQRWEKMKRDKASGNDRGFSGFSIV
ncbi:MAG: hypothetical protein HDS16_05215 [Bacteroides sp.]|nr:hypothetical protein [Bacteroides sp.]